MICRVWNLLVSSGHGPIKVQSLRLLTNLSTNDDMTEDILTPQVTMFGLSSRTTSSVRDRLQITFAQRGKGSIKGNFVPTLRTGSLRLGWGWGKKSRKCAKVIFARFLKDNSYLVEVVHINRFRLGSGAWSTLATPRRFYCVPSAW